MSAYIEECIHSLFAQSLRGLEIIAVDDGSTDDSVRIVKSMRVPDGVSLVVHQQQNSGLSSARNAGMRLAKGRWIGLVDGDDWVEPDMYLEMQRKAERLNVDFAICRGCFVDHTTRAVRPMQDRERWDALVGKGRNLFDPRKTPDLFILDTSACRRLYQRAFLQRLDFRFADGFLFEDILTNYQLMLNSSRVLLVDRDFYCYRVGQGNRITGRRDTQVLQILEIMNRVMDLLFEKKAGAQTWARLIWFQNWVLLWLCDQIDGAYTNHFARGACKIAGRFPAEGIQLYREIFADDRRSQLGVALQLVGSSNAYAAMAKSRDVAPRFAAMLLSRGSDRFLQMKPQLLARCVWTIRSRADRLMRRGETTQ